MSAENSAIAQKQYALPRAVIAVVPEKGGFIWSEMNEALAALLQKTNKASYQGLSLAESFDSLLADHWHKNLEAVVTHAKAISFRIMTQSQPYVSFQNFMLVPKTYNALAQVTEIEVIAIPPLAETDIARREYEETILYIAGLFDASGLGVIVTDYKGRIIRLNHTFSDHFGWQAKDLMGQEFIKFIPTHHETLQRLYKAFIERKKHGTWAVKVLHQNGEVIDTVITSMHVEFGQEHRYMISTVRDISERKKMMRRLQSAKKEADDANKAKSAFLCNMSHELRTPLNAIIGFSEIIKNEIFGPIANKKYDEYLSDIHFSARHLLDIINDILDMSKIEAGKVELIASDVHIGDMFRSVVRILNQKAKSSFLILETTISFVEGDYLLYADNRLVRQILINLVSNAIKFSEPGKKILMTAQIMENQNLLVEVIDQGKGIPADKISHVLEPFGQSYNPEHYIPTLQGTGLGLPIAKAMIEMHQGQLSLTSELDVGTKVSLIFPAERIKKQTSV